MFYESIWIIGAGRFGRIAFERLSGGKPRRRFTLVDPAVKEKSVAEAGELRNRRRRRGRLSS